MPIDALRFARPRSLALILTAGAVGLFLLLACKMAQTTEKTTMPSAREILTRFQTEFNQSNDSDSPLEDGHRLSFIEVDGLFHIEYRGLVHREPDWLSEEEDEMPSGKLPFFEILADPAVAGKVATLYLDGSPDSEANGTRQWDFGWLLAQDVTFPELKSLVMTYDPLNDDRLTILEDGGQLAGWLKKAPKLERLETPSAPNASFFKVEHEPLSSMRVYSGWYPEEFILNLSRLQKPFIQHLDWSEVHPWNVRDYKKEVTPYEHFEALVTSPACPPSLTLRNPELDEDQIKQLVRLHRETGKQQGWRRTSFEVFRTSYRFKASSDGDLAWRGLERHTFDDKWTHW
jgi:hypothetical protein